MKIWRCKIGEHDPIRERLAPGVSADQHMREGVALAYRHLTGHEPDFTFSGWGAELDEGERAVVEDREPDYFETGHLEQRLHKLRARFRRGLEVPTDWPPEQWVTLPMIKLGEAAAYLHSEIDGATKWGSQGADRERAMGIECLMATAAACLDAVEALEGDGQEEATGQAANG